MKKKFIIGIAIGMVVWLVYNNITETNTSVQKINNTKDSLIGAIYPW